MILQSLVDGLLYMGALLGLTPVPLAFSAGQHQGPSDLPAFDIDGSMTQQVSADSLLYEGSHTG
jgi:hypothetical protein